VLDELTRAVGEAAGIAVLDGRDVRCVLEVKPESEIQVRDWTGTLAPLHTVPAGLLFLSRFSTAALDAYLSGDLVASTDRSMTDPAAVRRRLADIARTGSVWVYGEFSADLNSVAAPIIGPDGQMLAALHVHGPSFRYPAKGRADAIAALVRDMAARLSAQCSQPPA
jgi:IclR family transcriptional regulator, KDG regulon repressor